MIVNVEWTAPADLTDQLLRLWSRGQFLRALTTGSNLFPLRLRLRGPDTRALGSRFEEVRSWIRNIEEGSRAQRGFGYEIEWADLNHRQLGRNMIPDRISVPTEDDALKLIGKEKEVRRFRNLLRSTTDMFPELAEWFARRPFVALDHAADWARILSVLRWFRENPSSGLYLRQIDIIDVDTKFIETRKPLLAELLAIVLNKRSEIDENTIFRTFEQRYGLRGKPSTVRFRILDRSSTIRGLSDIAVPEIEFASLALPTSRIFITENEINGLAFPDLPDSIVVFGLGYALDRLASASWLKDRTIHYWGDIDTHGFAMLDRLRAYFPHVRSLLMDRQTLLAHRTLWVREQTPHGGSLVRLDKEEKALFEDLVSNRLGVGIRLEQERIPFGWVQRALSALPVSTEC
jgi:hypothetical protein